MGEVPLPPEVDLYDETGRSKLGRFRIERGYYCDEVPEIVNYDNAFFIKDGTGRYRKASDYVYLDDDDKVKEGE